MTILTEFPQNTNADLGTDTVLSTVSFISLKTFKQARINNSVFAAVLTDLSKEFHCIVHELLIAKLNAYSFDSLSLKFASAYLNFRKQNTKVGSTFSDCVNILFGVPQGSLCCATFFQCLRLQYVFPN